MEHFLMSNNFGPMWRVHEKRSEVGLGSTIPLWEHCPKKASTLQQPKLRERFLKFFISIFSAL